MSRSASGGDNGGRWPLSQVISGNNLLAFCEREMPGEYGEVSEVVKYFYFIF